MNNVMANEIKAKVFAQYLGQKYGFYDGAVVYPPIFSKFELYEVNLNDSYLLEKYRLVLKPLSAITDEDKEYCYHLYCENCSYDYTQDYSGIKDAVNHWLKNHSKNIICFLATQHQFLQSKGYDLPQYLLGGKTLQESGLAIYEN